MSCMYSQSQELWPTSKLAPDWLHKSEQPIGSQVNKLTGLLTTTQTPKFPVEVYLYLCSKMRTTAVGKPALANTKLQVGIVFAV